MHLALRPTAKLACDRGRGSQCKVGYSTNKDVIGKGKAVPLQAESGLEGSRMLRSPDFVTTAQDGGKVVSLTHRPPLPPGNIPGTCPWRLAAALRSAAPGDWIVPFDLLPLAAGCCPSVCCPWRLAAAPGGWILPLDFRVVLLH